MRILGKFRSDLCNKTLVLEFGSSKKHIHQDTLRGVELLQGASSDRLRPLLWVSGSRHSPLLTSEES